MKIEITEEQIVAGVKSVLPSIIENIIIDTDIVENIVTNNIEPTVKKIVESGKLDKVLEDEVKRFINDDWDICPCFNVIEGSWFIPEPFFNCMNIF